MASITIDTTNIGELRASYDLTVDQINVAIRRSARKALTQLRTYGRQELASDPRIVNRLARRRVLTPQKFPGTLFMGGDETVGRIPLSKAGRKTRGRGARSVTVDGKVIPNAFVRIGNETKKRFRGIPFRQGSDGRIRPVFVPIQDEVLAAFQETEDQAPELLQELFYSEFRRQAALLGGAR